MSDNEVVERPQRKWVGSVWFWIGLGFAAIVIVTVVGVLVEERNPVAVTVSTSTDEDLRRDAYTECKVAVLGYLKSPRSADFPWYEPSFVVDMGSEYRVTAYVDAENSFGASIRTPWSCSVSRTSSGWAVNSVNIR